MKRWKLYWLLTQACNNKGKVVTLTYCATGKCQKVKKKQKKVVNLPPKPDKRYLGNWAHKELGKLSIVKTNKPIGDVIKGALKWRPLMSVQLSVITKAKRHAMMEGVLYAHGKHNRMLRIKTKCGKQVEVLIAFLLPKLSKNLLMEVRHPDLVSLYLCKKKVESTVLRYRRK